MAEHDPARLAAIDQQLAELNGQLNRSGRVIMWADAWVLAAALALIGMELAGAPQLSRWEVVAWLAIAASLAAGSLIQARMLRSCRAEIRDLRSGRS
jgi:hypothetical protein